MGHETARFIDQEVNELLTSCYDEASRILKQEQILLKHLADILLQIETLDGEEFDIIVECSTQKKTAADSNLEINCSTCTEKKNCRYGQSFGVDQRYRCGLY